MVEERSINDSFEKKYSLTEVLGNETDSVKFTDFENFLNVYKDEQSFFRFNLNSTLYVRVPSSRLKTFKCQHDMHWSTISYNIYTTVRLAWLLMKLNNISPALAFEKVPAGSSVKYLDRSDVTMVIDKINSR